MAAKEEPPSDGFCSSRRPQSVTMLDDAAILAMCDPDGGNDDSDRLSSSYAPSSATSHPPPPPPLSFGMEGSTININHSTDIHFGPKTVAPVAPSTPFLFGSSASAPSSAASLLLQSEGTSCDERISPSNTEEDGDRFSISSSIDLRSASPPRQEHQHTLREFSNACTTPFLPTFISSQSTPHHLPPRLPCHRGSCGETGVVPDSSADMMLRGRAVRKAISTPVGDAASTSAATATAVILANPPNDRVCVPQSSQAQTSPLMSAAINNSSNVQMGTQIVYNYYLTDSEQRPPPIRTNANLQNSSDHVHASGDSLSALPLLEDYLVRFRERLVSVYRKRSRSSPLPWHRGRQLIPLNEYYTEPQIFAVDKCGNRTSETVQLTSLLGSKNERRFLVEGETGMGKTILTTKLAEAWASGTQLQQFAILLLVTLADFKGSLQQFVREELLPSYFKKEDFEKVWEFCKSHDKQILFVLDGYDELSRHDRGEIDNLIKSKDFPESKVVVTSRPNFLQEWEKKIVVSGFGQLQIMEFIEKYFRAIGNDECGRSLRRIIEKEEKYWKLAKRPLFCMLLCMLYMTRGEVGETLPERQSQVMLQMMLCLVKWNRKNDGHANVDLDVLPTEYEKPFHNFGKICLNALKTEQTRFSDQEVRKVDGFESRLKQLGFLYNDNESHALGERKFWKPVHQTFLEYLAAFYMAKHIRDCKMCKECKSYDAVFQRFQEVLKFTVGILNNKAYKILDGQRFPVVWKLPATKVLQLLKEAEPRSENCAAVARLLDRSAVEVSTSEVELEGWSFVLAQSFRRLETLRIAWRIKSASPDQESSFAEASDANYALFFDALKRNQSIREIQVRAKQDGEPFSDEKMRLFFGHLKSALEKKNLQELHVVEMKMRASGYLRRTFEDIAEHSSKLGAFQELKVLRLHTFMEDADLRGICDALATCAPNLQTLSLEGLEHGRDGFQSLVRLLKKNANIHNLHISMNQSLFVNVFGSHEDEYPPVQMRSEHRRMHRTAERKSRHAFGNSSAVIGSSEDDFDCQAQDSHEETDLDEGDANTTELDPLKELSFLFDKQRALLQENDWTLEARRFWYLRRKTSAGDVRIPLPLCVNREHKSVFHFLFKELPKTFVKNLTLSQAGLYLTTADMICLGDAIRKSVHLNSISLQSLDKAERYMPLLLGLGQSSSLSTLDFSSSKVTMGDAALEAACAALRANESLRSLSLGRWQFQFQNCKEVVSTVRRLLDSWHVTHLDLRQCSVELGVGGEWTSQAPSSPPSQPLNAFFGPPTGSAESKQRRGAWRSLKTLSLESVELKELGGGIMWRGHLLLFAVTDFANLTSLDLSLSQARCVVQVDNMAARRFFGLVGSELRQLAELTLDGWQFCLRRENGESAGDIASRLHACKKLRSVKLERVNEIVPEDVVPRGDLQNHGQWCRNTFLHQLVSYIPNLEEVSLCYYRLNGSPIEPLLAARLGQCLHDHWHHVPFKVKFFNLSAEVDNAIFRALKRPPCRVKRTVGPSLFTVFEVRSVLTIIKRH